MLLSAQKVLRFPFLAVAILSLLLGMLGGLQRLGWFATYSWPVINTFHGPLMVCSFLGTLVSLERAVALNRFWGYLAPLFQAVGGIILLLGLSSSLAGVFFLLGSLFLLLVLSWFLKQHPTLHGAILVLGSVCLVIGTSLFVSGTFVSQLVSWWVGFLVFTIAGERLELSRLVRRPKWAEAVFISLIVLFFVGASFDFLLVGVALIGLACGSTDGGGRVYVYLSNGDGTFASSTLTGMGVLGAYSADLNADGHIDIVNSTSASSTTYVRLGNGDGTFSAVNTFAGAGIYQSYGFGDVNRDGNMDILSASGNPASGVVALNLGNGDGSFKAVSFTATGLWTNTTMSAADINEDGIIDFAISGGSQTVLKYWLADTVTGYYASDLTIATQAKAQNVLEVLDNALTNLSAERASLGAYDSRLSFSESYLMTHRENLTGALSMIEDADIAESTADLVRQQILQQAQVATLGQANLSMQAVLSLLAL